MREIENIDVVGLGRNQSSLPPAFVTLLTRKECNAIFSARTRMLNENGNYHNRNTDPICRVCGNKTETQEHILEECPALMDEKMKKITATDIFETKIGKLKSKQDNEKTRKI